MNDKAVRDYARARRFADALRDRWLARSEADQRALLDLAERLRLGENQFRDVFDQIESIAARRDTSVAGVLSDEAIERTLAAGQGRNETLHRLKKVLRRLRYPQLSENEARLKSLGRALRLPSNVEVDYPEDLEGTFLSFRIRVESPAALREAGDLLAETARRPEVAEMFRILGGVW